MTHAAAPPGQAAGRTSAGEDGQAAGRTSAGDAVAAGHPAITSESTANGTPHGTPHDTRDRSRGGAGGRAIAALLLAAAAHAPVAGALWGATGRAANPFPTDRLLDLAAAHAALAGLGGTAGIVAGLAIGLAVTRPAGHALRPIAETLTALAQAIPPVVVVALALPALGFGWPPAALALLLYAVMPVARATIGALEATPPDAIDAARAMGMTRGQVLRQVEAPLAWPLVLPAVRVAMVLATSTAAIGALAGAATLGTPIVLGLQNQNELMLLQGAAATAALAFAIDAGVLALARPGSPVLSAAKNAGGS